MSAIEYLKNHLRETLPGKTYNPDFYFNVHKSKEYQVLNVFIYGQNIANTVFEVDAKNKSVGVYIRDAKGKTIINEKTNNVFATYIQPKHCRVTDVDGNIVTEW